MDSKIELLKYFANSLSEVVLNFLSIKMHNLLHLQHVEMISAWQQGFLS